MDKNERAEAIYRRMIAAGLDRGRLAQLVGKDRTTIIRALKGEASPDTYAAIEQWFDREDAKVGAEPPQVLAAAATEHEHVTFRLTGNFGVDVVVEGPVEDMAELKSAAMELLREMQRSPRE